ncbi:MAG TPA: DedA family protein [Terriglobales bacterium]|nr:DedA family protein [Terriglobales bacterium]
MHSLLALWFDLTLRWGYGGVFTLMAIESTVFPLPSEVVIPPAAYLATQGHLHFWGVVAAAALGSWGGSALSYWVARAAGRPLILRFGRYVLVPEKKWLLAERWINRYGAAGIFFARLLPVVRHLVSLPAGAARMNFRVFTTMTLLGSLLWSTVLAWFGARVLGDKKEAELRAMNPRELVALVQQKLHWFLAAALVLLALYVIVEILGRRLRRQAGATEAS